MSTFGMFWGFLLWKMLSCSWQGSCYWFMSMSIWSFNFSLSYLKASISAFIELFSSTTFEIFLSRGIKCISYNFLRTLSSFSDIAISIFSYSPYLCSFTWSKYSFLSRFSFSSSISSLNMSATSSSLSLVSSTIYCRMRSLALRASRSSCILVSLYSRSSFSCESWLKVYSIVWLELFF